MDQKLLELLDKKPGFREWVEQTDFTHMLKLESEPETPSETENNLADE